MEISTYIRASVVAFEFGPLAASDKFSGQRRCVTRYCSVVSNAPHRCETYKLDCFSYTEEDYVEITSYVVAEH